MRSTLAVTAPAAELGLLTTDELRAAVGVKDDSKDEQLEAIGDAVAAAIMSDCNIRVGAGAPPTLLRETLTETFYWPPLPQLVLGRRHEVEVTSVTVDDVALEADEYAIDVEAGILVRMGDGTPSGWYAKKVVAIYDAGFATLPPDLKKAAADFVRASYAEGARDPYVKGIETEIPGVERKRVDYWVGSVPGQASADAVPDIVAGQLKRFRNAAIG